MLPCLYHDVAILTMNKTIDKLDEPTDFSLVLGGPLFQLFRRAHLTGDALELVRQRLIIISLLAWLPLWMLSALRIALTMFAAESEVRTFLYLGRLVAFCIILWAIFRKNRETRSGQQPLVPERP